MVAAGSNALYRMLVPVAECLTSESAQRLINLHLDDELQRRIDILAAKSSDGTISDAERSEYLEYVEAIDFIGILQSQARQILSRRQGS
jgi:hypothetical protein